MGRILRSVERVGHAIEGQRWLDIPSYRLEHALALTVNVFGDASGRIRNTLHGTWLGHPVHPVLTDVPVGAWTTALVFDITAGRAPGGDPARRCIAVGLAGAGAAAVTGLADWQYTHDNARRLGLAHAMLNIAATGLYAGSWRARRRGAVNHGRALSTAGYLIAMGSAYLGGTLVSRHQVGVDHSDHQLEPRTYTAVLPERDLRDGEPTQVAVAGTDITLVRDNGRIHAVPAHCSHLGGPLPEGWLYRGSLVCPWHGSHFDLESGEVLAGPATAPLECLDVRTRDGQIEVRRRPPVSQAPPGSVVAREQRRADAGD